MARKFVALIRKEESTDYWVDIPDLPGCVSSGKSEEEAKANFREALEMHLAAMREDILSLSKARSRDEILSAERDPYISDYMIEIGSFQLAANLQSYKAVVNSCET